MNKKRNNYLMQRVLALMLAFCATAFLCAGAAKAAIRPGNATAGLRNVVINGVRLSDSQVYALEYLGQTPMQNGRYWYDPYCGAWGYEGGPTAGFTYAGLKLGGSLRADASNGNTGIFINGRELDQTDRLALQQLLSIGRGRYWADARGNLGYEGGPARVNVVQIAAQLRQQQEAQGYPPELRKGSVFTTWDLTMRRW